MDSKAIYINYNRFIGKHLSTVHHNFILRGLLYFYLSHKPGFSSNRTFKSFIEFICADIIDTPEGCNVDIEALRSLYDDMSNMTNLVTDDKNFTLFYELTYNRLDRKKSGIYYTPEHIVKPILDNLLNAIDIINNPYIKILDPSCGCGNFLCCAYEKLYKLYTDNLDSLCAKYGSYWDKKYVGQHILKYNLYGADIDSNAVAITRHRLLLISGSNNFSIDNIVLCNSLMKYENSSDDNHNPFISSFWNQKFDFIIGNPPYQNMQKSSPQFKKYVIENYPEIYSGQNDLYYYFIYRSVEKLKEGGKLCFIVPPYFIKATHGVKLRDYISRNLNIDYLEDITYLKPFYKTQVHSCIFIGSRKGNEIPHTSIRKIYINSNKVLIIDNNKWTIADNNIISIIERLDHMDKLGSYTSICKGMDTGLNQCFLVNQDIIDKYNLEPELLWPVIRSGNIDKYIIKNPHRNKMIYIPHETDISEYPNTYRYLIKFYDKLTLRWSYKRKLCDWYSISTPRNIKHFESKNLRIFVPYRANTNKFALDMNCSIGLTDTTVLFPKDELYTYYLTGILNSRLIRFYNSFCGKRKGDILEFFPEPLSKLPVVPAHGALFYEIVDSVKKIIDIWNNCAQAGKEKMLEVQEHIDNVVFEIYNMEKTDIKQIKEAGI